MPELPEVETIKNDLRPTVEGHSFTSASIYWPKMVLQPSTEELCQHLPGQTINEIARRGKYLLFRLANGKTLIMHMRMTGSLLIREIDGHSNELLKYITAEFRLNNKHDILFRDPRKFGTVSLVNDEIELEKKLGPEPLDPTFSIQSLSAKLTNRKAPIKAILCDQQIVAGIGNMYADEALFSAKLHPTRQANELQDKEVANLHQAIRDVLKKGISNAGASFSDYQRPNGQRGTQQDHFQVAHRGRQTCYVCSTPIERIPIRNRGTYFCPKCQV